MQEINKKRVSLLLVIMFVIAFNSGVAFFVFTEYHSKNWASNVEEISESKVKEYINDLGCELQKKEKDEYFEFNYYTKKSSCDYNVSFVKTEYTDIAEEILDDFEYNGPNRKVDDSWNLESLFYYYYSEIGKNYRVIVQSGDTILSIDSKKANKDKVDSVFKKLNLDYEYKYLIDLNEDFIIPLIVMFFIVWWRVCVKFGRKGWVALIPIYNVICLSDDVFGEKAMAILYFVPIANIVYGLLVFWKLGKFFNKDKKYCFLTMLFPGIFVPILAFLDYPFIKSKTDH